MDAKSYFQKVKGEYKNKVNLMVLDPLYDMLQYERDQLSKTDINTIMD